MTRRRLVQALLALAATAAVAREDSVQPDQVMITCQFKAGTRQISGVSHSLEWSFEALAAGRAQVHLAVPIASFDSGHRAFDSLLRKTLEGHPYAIIEGAASADRFEGTLALRGVVRPLAIPLTSARDGGNLIATASFDLDLSEYGIALPGVEPRATIGFVARIVAGPKAVLAGGVVNQVN